MDPGWLQAVQTAIQGCWQQTPEMRSNLQEVRTLLDTARSNCIFALTPSPMRGPQRNNNNNNSSPADIPRINLDGSTYVPPSDAHAQRAADTQPLVAPRSETPPPIGQAHAGPARNEPSPNNPLDSPELVPAMWPELRPAPMGIVALVFTDVQGSSKVRKIINLL